MPMRILCVHQGHELYGSDRCFLESVQAIRRFMPGARIDVILPKEGPLLAPLLPFADAVRFAPLWVLRKHGLLRRLPAAPLSLPLALARAVFAFRQHDLVYINTVTVLDYLLAARLFRGRALLHVHEAPEGAIGAGLRALVHFVGAPTIFNSQATRRAYRPRPKATSYVLYNGVPAPDAPRSSDYDGRRRLRLLVLGRLSLGKGQDLVLDACASLPPALQDAIDVRIVGSTFGAQPALEQALRARAARLARPEAVRFEPFAVDTSPLYRWSDVVLVPSRVREGFGRVAAEAMAHARAPIVAAHGGLPEIVADRCCGWCVRPGDPMALAAAIREALASPHLVAAFGAAARARFEVSFTDAIAQAGLAAILRARTSGEALA